MTYDPCSPIISIPQAILTLDPQWADCVPGVSGLYDPPSKLTPVHGFETGALVQAQSTQGAVPGSSPRPAVASQTSEPGPKQTVNSPQSATPSVPHPQPAQTSLPDLPIITALPAKAVIDGSTITADPASVFVMGTNTLVPGDAITYGEKAYSLVPNGASLVIGGTSVQVLHPQYAIGSQTLIPGAAAIIVSSVQVSLDPAALTVVAGGRSMPLSALMGHVASVTTAINPTQAAGAGFIGSASLVSGRKMTALSVIIGADTVPSVVIGENTEALSDFAAEMTGDVSLILGSKTVPLAALLGTLKTASKSEALGAIATSGGFESSSRTITALASQGQVGTSKNNNGAEFVGKATTTRGGNWKEWPVRILVGVWALLFLVLRD